jgi:predicted dehydrogenase
MPRIRIGIVGAGERGIYVLGARIVDSSALFNLEITAICDINEGRIKDATQFIKGLCITKQLEWGESIFGTTDYKELVDREDVDLIMITTHTDHHRDPALYAIASKKYVYLDKPIAVTLDDAMNIIESEVENNNFAIMGFTRRYETGWRKAHQLLMQGEIGNLQMMQIHSIIPYTRYLQMWHRTNDASGGALNDKASHLLDVFNWMNSSSRCTHVVAVGGKSGIFSPREDAPFRCIYCDDALCSYRRSANINDDREGTHVLHRPSWLEATNTRDSADTCVYYPGSDIIDHAIATYVYDNGVKASLFWAIYGPHANDQETLSLIGSKGRIVLERETGLITVHKILPGPDNEETYTIEAKGEFFNSSHYGADMQLIKELYAKCNAQKVNRSESANTSDGYTSLQMVIATEDSINRQGMSISILHKGQRS